MHHNKEEAMSALIKALHNIGYAMASVASDELHSGIVFARSAQEYLEGADKHLKMEKSVRELKMEKKESDDARTSK